MKDKLLLAVIAYGMLTSALFGNPAQPIALFDDLGRRLGIPFWRGIVASQLLPPSWSLCGSLGICFRRSAA